MIDFKPFLTGRVVKRVRTDRGDFFIVLAEGPASRRFRADAGLFHSPDDIEPDTLISFYADETRRTAKSLPRIRQVLFQPQA